MTIDQLAPLLSSGGVVAFAALVWQLLRTHLARVEVTLDRQAAADEAQAAADARQATALERLAAGVDALNLRMTALDRQRRETPDNVRNIKQPG